LVRLVEDRVGVSDAKVTSVNIDHGLSTGFDSGLETIVLELCRAFLQTSLDVPLVQLNVRAVKGFMVPWMRGGEQSTPEDGKFQRSFQVHLVR
jgi:hypothetical protein